MNKNQELVSIIIPVYNVEKYLKKCIDSVIEQTYKNIEIILVDDGSPDKSPQVCDDYKKMDKRIIVIHKKNGGLSDARNEGIKRSNGIYLYFLDSDDFIEKDAIEYLLKIMNQYNADISSYGFWNYFNEESCSRDEKIEKDYIEIMSSVESIKKCLDLKCSFKWRVTNKLYKKKVFKNVTFPDGKLYEDVGTTYKLLINASKIVYSSIPKYYYVQNSASITNTYKFNLKEINRIEMCNDFCEDVLKEFPNDVELKKMMTSFKCSQYISVVNVMLRSDKFDEKIIIETKKMLRKNYCWIYKILSKKQKIQFLFLSISFRLYKIVFKTIIR